MNQNSYYKLISGKSQGLLAGLAFISLIAVSKIYNVIIRLRNYFYNKHIFAIHHTDAKVISIGNITAGGTGKTPLVTWLCNEITSDQKTKTNGYKLAILTRGYKTTQSNVLSNTEGSKLRTQNYIDEPAVLAENCHQASIVINPDRVMGASQAIGKFAANVLVMDDGFQHRRLARDLDIVTIDATCPFGYERLIPAGLLREPVKSLKRAHAIVLTRCDHVSETQIKQIENKLLGVNPNILIARSIHQAVYIKTIDNRKISLEQFKNKKVFAFCGIGNPEAFITSLKNMGYDIVGSKFFNDHHNYTENCLIDLKKQSQFTRAEVILTTQKDWTKIFWLETAKNMPLAYAVIEIKFLSGQDKLRYLIEDTLTGKISRIGE
jgi:tetraacyldisaccharide 4'-kinase